VDATELAFAGIGRQADLIAAREVSSRELVEIYLDRIERFDGELNAFRVVLAEKALLEADQADARARAAADAPLARPLLGVPLAVKDNIDVAGEITAVGTSAQDQPARADAEIVRRLRAAGAVVIGKTNVPELCAVPWTESESWGSTRNPWDPTRTPGGSSGGSAAAVAAGLVGAALANDGAGSIRYPAAYCGLFGLKPQRGRLPAAPDLDPFRGLSVNGVLTRSVADTARFYDAISEGPRDGGAPALAPTSMVAATDGGQGGSRGPLRIGVAINLPRMSLAGLHADHAAAVRETAELLGNLGHEVHEVKLDHGAVAPAPELMIRFLAGVADAADALPHPERLESRMRMLTRTGGLMQRRPVGWARAREPRYGARMNRPFASCDVLLTPVTPKPAPPVAACAGRGWFTTMLFALATVPYAAPWNVTGQPAAAVPAGFGAGGLPRSVQLVGRPNDEPTLIALASQLEAARPWTQSRPPQFS
jgi:amidase